MYEHVYMYMCVCVCGCCYVTHTPSTLQGDPSFSLERERFVRIQEVVALVLLGQVSERVFCV